MTTMKKGDQEQQKIQKFGIKTTFSDDSSMSVSVEYTTFWNGSEIKKIKMTDQIGNELEVTL